MQVRHARLGLMYFALATTLLFAAPAHADDCSANNRADCERTSGYNATVSLVSVVALAGGALFGGALGGAGDGDTTSGDGDPGLPPPREGGPGPEPADRPLPIDAPLGEDPLTDAGLPPPRIPPR